jgi:hypothetical protein
VVQRVLAIVDNSPLNDRVLIVDDSVLPKTGKEYGACELVIKNRIEGALVVIL